MAALWIETALDCCNHYLHDILPERGRWSRASKRSRLASVQTLEAAKVTAALTQSFSCPHLLRLLSSLYTFCSVYLAPAPRMATSASAETALAEPSFNLQLVASPRLHQDVPERTCTPQHKSVQSVATPQRTGESPLAPKDLNSPGAGLLIDVEPSQSRECTYPGRATPRERVSY